MAVLATSCATTTTRVWLPPSPEEQAAAAEGGGDETAEKDRPAADPGLEAAPGPLPQEADGHDPADAPGAPVTRLSLCRAPADGQEELVDRTRRRLYETACAATLWFDGLFGDERHLPEARNVSGYAEVGTLGSEFEGAKVRGRFNLRATFPNLEERVEAFFGREDQDDFIRDRREGPALRSQFLELRGNDGWLTGLGYRLPGTARARTDFRVGAKLRTSPEIFVQARHRRVWFFGERSLLHARETVFWTNRDGWGSTTGLDFDRILTSRLLFRWGNVGTVSEATKGLLWRSAWVVFQNLGRQKALAYEAFVRGETAAPEPLREYGIRSIFRQPVFGREWLFGELILGYSWPRTDPGRPREGSVTVGVGMQMFFGQE